MIELGIVTALLERSHCHQTCPGPTTTAQTRPELASSIGAGLFSHPPPSRCSVWLTAQCWGEGE